MRFDLLRRVPVVVVAGLLVLSTALFAQNTPPNSYSVRSLPSSQPDGKIITVWKVGRPYENGLPSKTISPGLKRGAEALGYEIRVETFSAVNFPDEFFAAFQKNQEPDILAVQNRGTIFGITMRSGIIFGSSVEFVGKAR